MKVEENQPLEPVEELPDSWWYRVYFAVIITTILVISGLWAFSRYFSS
jgi:hypothetical protein